MSYNLTNTNSCSATGGIKSVYLVKTKDLKVTKDGSVTLKRKYGKYKREIVRVK